MQVVNIRSRHELLISQLWQYLHYMQLCLQQAYEMRKPITKCQFARKIFTNPSATSFYRPSLLMLTEYNLAANLYCPSNFIGTQVVADPQSRPPLQISRQLDFTGHFTKFFFIQTRCSVNRFLLGPKVNQNDGSHKCLATTNI